MVVIRVVTFHVLILENTSPQLPPSFLDSCSAGVKITALGQVMARFGYTDRIHTYSSSASIPNIKTCMDRNFPSADELKNFNDESVTSTKKTPFGTSMSNLG